MGCDIHVQCHKEVAPGVYVEVDTEWEGDRDYRLFGVINGVRIDYTSQGIPMIAGDRGAGPVMASLPAKVHQNDWFGDHSFTWFKASEVVAWDAQGLWRADERSGVITLEQFYEWDKESVPVCYCGGVSGRNVVTVVDPISLIKAGGCLNDYSGLYMLMGENQLAALQGKEIYVMVFWREILNYELKPFIDEMKRLVALHGDVIFSVGYDS